ncbi:acyltransferase [Cytophagaceae bacterium DM2B3-1]|uniref:Acyltransferase n=1 Tax=Xanthocytophaga flava TaxID=3048013 RepID=A0ABT7CDF4_9BACT|nr:acyltransferase [Xanthocytophaga flavus]MDJ1471643.1 acyltransferase [Xanthocytophaga flavus]MDJ1491710.1 acyltransferase [Xanthocytophaga flavus]
MKYIYYWVNERNIISHQSATIRGWKNISTHGLLKIGVDYIGFTHNKDVTFLNIYGKIITFDNVSIGRGCRFDIGGKAIVKIGKGTYINPFTKVIIMHGLEIGEYCAISWDCQFLDEDFHEIQYEGKKSSDSNIIHIGNKVWIGSNVAIYKGTTIPNGCVVASNSVVKTKFEEENVLIAGNPAKIIKRNIYW